MGGTRRAAAARPRQLRGRTGRRKKETFFSHCAGSRSRELLSRSICNLAPSLLRSCALTYRGSPVLSACRRERIRKRENLVYFCTFKKQKTNKHKEEENEEVWNWMGGLLFFSMVAFSIFLELLIVGKRWRRGRQEAKTRIVFLLSFSRERS